jgi:hypothetical protein
MNDWHVDERKILDYLLNQRSATGAAKSRFFESGGFTREAWQVFRAALVARARTATLQEVDTSSPYGEKHVFHCNIATPNARDPCIRTVWQKRDGDFWLVTAYPFD